MNIIDRIKQIIDYKGISTRKFCIEIGVANGFFDKVKDIGIEKALKILKTYPEISVEWLILGEGKMLKSENNSIDIKPVDNEWLLHRFEEVVAENALLKKENNDLKLSQGKSNDITNYTELPKKIGSHIAAEPKK